jgi:hypothetical protein
MRPGERQDTLPENMRTVKNFDRQKLQYQVVTPIAIWAASRLIVLVSWCISTAFVKSAGLKETFLRWDGGWYFSVVTNGYSNQRGAGASNIAFFPGFPLLSKAVSYLPLISEYRATVIVTLLMGLASVCLFHLLASRVLVDGETSTLATILFTFTPGAVVFSMFYSEGLFIALSIASLYFLIKKQFVAAAVLACLVGTVRPSGIVLIAVVYLSVFIDCRQHFRIKKLVPLAIAPLGMVGYGLYLQQHVGSISSYFETQSTGWGEKFSLTARVDDFGQLLRWFTSGFGSADWNKVVPGAMTLLIVIALVGCWKLKPPIELMVFTIGILGMSFFSSTLGFRPRFVMTAFPLFFGLSALLRSPVQRYVAVSLSVASLALYSMVVFQLLYQTP